MHSYLLPEVVLVIWTLGLLLLEAWGGWKSRAIGYLSLAGLAIAAGLTAYIGNNPHLFFHGLYAWDGLARFFKFFFIAATALVVWITMEFEAKIPTGKSEFYIITLLTSAGMQLLASANDLMVLFVGLELVTISFYILVAYQRRNPVALEAGVKYLILGALSSAFLVMGIAYVFGLTGSTQFEAIRQALPDGAPTSGILLGLGLILVGLGFKIAISPFHIWAPDVYEGAPLPVTAFLSVGSKAAGFVLMLRAFMPSGPFGSLGLAQHWVPLFVLLSIISMVLGNLAAIPQRRFKRMMAYSSIGHSGFLLLGLAASGSLKGDPHLGLAAVLYYLVSYLLASLTAFLVATKVSEMTESDAIHSYAGLVQRSPLLAGAMAVAMVSLAGIPPMSGFFGKLLIFLAVWQDHFYWSFAFGVVSAVAGLYYYLGVVRVMFWSEPVDASSITISKATAAVLLVLTAATITLGFWAQPVIAWIQTVFFI